MGGGILDRNINSDIAPRGRGAVFRDDKDAPNDNISISSGDQPA